jgi:hypothetical protein
MEKHFQLPQRKDDYRDHKTEEMESTTASI